MKTIHAVAGILMRNSRLLVAERPKGKPYSGFWEFPGGKIEQNESGESALKRELQEELGIEVMAASHLFDHTYSYPDKIVHLEIWLVAEFSGEPKSLENQAIQWLTREEILSLPLLEGNWPVMDKLVSIF
ncbi:CTP pyrophosphohydrolase [Aquicella siphonis]|uniref:8-oxo-dGTP diphosphatase n=1 Tax=Aquicella siphonis TaxID=254247 RepID=A0A5E4PIX6_9COXI|nr:CTP pyrophosphohydrolase [Aquicella siphonis]